VPIEVAPLDGPTSKAVYGTPVKEPALEADINGLFNNLDLTLLFAFQTRGAAEAVPPIMENNGSTPLEDCVNNFARTGV
jgi:hypothetical protein